MKKLILFVHFSLIIVNLCFFSNFEAKAEIIKTYTNYVDGQYQTIEVTLDDNGVLTFDGIGAIPDSQVSYSNIEWGEKVTSVVINNGITRIGNYTFQRLYNLKSITIPESVTYIGDHAFWGSGNIEEIHISSLESWLSIFLVGLRVTQIIMGLLVNFILVNRNLQV